MAATIRDLWHRFAPLPAGRWLFSRVLGRIVPYTGSIRPDVRELGPGGAVIALHDRRAVRNHLNSLHALALANLAELTTGLPLAFGVQPAARTILVSLTVDFVKKARGTVTATSSFPPPDATRDGEIEIPVEIRDAAGDVVTRARARWRYGPLPSRTT
ncbi:MAG TPA: DUF4442 domain-containing protein [Gemmatimonadaceae bacterium]|nr:DUF4442 domain-containing protein [Gemmatimonadaceae bacterium]